MSRLPETTESAVEAYLKYLKTERRVQDRSLTSYRGNLHGCFIRLEAAGYDTLPTKIDRDAVNFLLDTFKRDDLAVKTRKNYIAALKGYMSYYNNNTISRMKIRWPHDTRPNVKWLTREQTQKLSSHKFDDPVVNLLIHCELCLGMRRIEVLRLTKDSFNSDRVKIDGKGKLINKIRFIPPHRRTREILNEYLDWRQAQVDIILARRPSTIIPDDLLIWRRFYTIGSFEQVKAQALNNRLKAAGQECLGIDNLSHHTLRRMFGRTMWMDKIKIETIAKMLGHETLEQCMAYIGVNIGDMESAMSQFSL